MGGGCVRRPQFVCKLIQHQVPSTTTALPSGITIANISTSRKYIWHSDSREGGGGGGSYWCPWWFGRRCAQWLSMGVTSNFAHRCCAHFRNTVLTHNTQRVLHIAHSICSFLAMNWNMVTPFENHTFFHKIVCSDHNREIFCNYMYDGAIPAHPDGLFWQTQRRSQALISWTVFYSFSAEEI